MTLVESDPIAPPMTPLTSNLGWNPRAIFTALLGNFALFGVTLGAQGVLWAELLPRIGIGMGAFGSAQLLSPLVSVGLLLQGGHLAARFGKKRLSVASFGLLGLGALVLAAGDSPGWLVVALLLLGAGNGLFEIAMNGATIDVERANGRPILNLLHAGFSGGAVIGALGAGVLLGIGWSAAQVLSLLAVLSAVAVLASLVVGFPPADAAAGHVESAAATLRLVFSRRDLLALAAICGLGAVGESVPNLWAVLYLRELGAGDVAGGATLALMGGTMLLGRVANASVVARIGARPSLLISGVGLAAATVLLVLPGGVPLAVIGFGLVGLAVAGVIPTVIGAAAQVVPARTDTITGGMIAAGYLSFMLCPPIVGWVSELFSLRTGLLVIGLSGLAILWLARTATPPDAHAAAATP